MADMLLWAQQSFSGFLEGLSETGELPVDFNEKLFLRHEMVRTVLPQAEIYVYENDVTKQIDGFIGLLNEYIKGIFVREGVQSNGIGKQLLEYAKCVKSNMSLCVYQENTRGIQFYQKEQFLIQSENIDDNTNQKEYVMIWKK